MNKIIIIFCLICLAVSVLVSLYLYAKGKIELKKEKKQERKNAKIDKETIENINVVAGDDFHAGNDILHQLAEKRK